MKTALRILKILFSCVLLLLALAFAVIEGRLLVSGDWLLHEVPILAVLTYASRFILSIIAGYAAYRILFTTKSSHKTQPQNR